MKNDVLSKQNYNEPRIYRKSGLGVNGRKEAKQYTSVSCKIPPSRILIMHSSSLCVPNSLSSVALLAASCAFWAPCLNLVLS